jgi:hypothetical protein
MAMASMPECACPTHRVEICEVWRSPVQLSSERGNQLDDLIAQRALAPPDAFDIVQEQIDHIVLVAPGLAEWAHIVWAYCRIEM